MSSSSDAPLRMKAAAADKEASHRIISPSARHACPVACARGANIGDGRHLGKTASAEARSKSGCSVGCGLVLNADAIGQRCGAVLFDGDGESNRVGGELLRVEVRLYDFPVAAHGFADFDRNRTGLVIAQRDFVL